MGLWLGASVLAVAQFLDYLAQRCSQKCCYRNTADATDEPVSNGDGEPTKSKVSC